MCGACAAADRASASVEKPDFATSLIARQSESLLRLVEGPLTRENAAVFVAVAISDHDLLDRQVALG